MIEIKAHFDGKVLVPDEPVDLPQGKTLKLQVFTDAEEISGGTFGDFLNSGLVGIWKDRTDIGDSVEFARKLREQAQRRSHE
jgi:hypothetical protein